MFKKVLNEGQAGENVGLLLRGTKRDDVERGQVVCKPGTIKPHTKFEGEIYALSKDEGGRHTPFFSNYKPQFFFRTADITGGWWVGGEGWVGWSGVGGGVGVLLGHCRSRWRQWVRGRVVRRCACVAPCWRPTTHPDPSPHPPLIPLWPPSNSPTPAGTATLPPGHRDGAAQRHT